MLFTTEENFFLTSVTIVGKNFFLKILSILKSSIDSISQTAVFFNLEKKYIYEFEEFLCYYLFSCGKFCYGLIKNSAKGLKSKIECGDQIKTLIIILRCESLHEKVLLKVLGVGNG